MGKKKTLQDRMNELKPYFRGIEMYNDALMVKVTYPREWKAYPSDDERIKVAPSEEDGSGLIYYYADSSNTTYEDMFDLIEQTVKANQEVVLKLELLKTKVNELRELFSEMPYEELLTLRFETASMKKEKPKRKYTKKKKEVKEEEKENVEVVEEVEENK